MPAVLAHAEYITRAGKPQGKYERVCVSGLFIEPRPKHKDHVHSKACIHNADRGVDHDLFAMRLAQQTTNLVGCQP